MSQRPGMHRAHPTEREAGWNSRRQNLIQLDRGDDDAHADTSRTRVDSLDRCRSDLEFTGLKRRRPRPAVIHDHDDDARGDTSHARKLARPMSKRAGIHRAQPPAARQAVIHDDDAARSDTSRTRVDSLDRLSQRVGIHRARPLSGQAGIRDDDDAPGDTSRARDDSLDRCRNESEFTALDRCRGRLEFTTTMMLPATRVAREMARSTDVAAT
ncbi:hypothetical protein R3P38DRAFT_3216178 [Favolaschia claudopus]|uniref:Uncharacterized protein n=1 Tax=Favolaschia claudopus TaxID=2862362 RepID=A0AAW0A6V6_9AGAR